MNKTQQIQVAKAGAHPLRVQIMQAVEDGLAASPNSLAALLDEPLGNVSYHVKTLWEYGCLELKKTVPRRGAVEHFYRSTGLWSPGRECVLKEDQRRRAAHAIEAVLAAAATGEFPLADREIEAYAELRDHLLEGLLEPVAA